ncbi:Mlo-related protein [Dillenia turbinata]|uniref:MLO-like protein n=1 Tax=Dillenia turbinata TaxID=194707 RepID=A0AAN8UUC8_9MAGN
MGEESRSLEYTPTWVVAAVCFVIILISLIVERALHRLGKLLLRRNLEALFAALQKLKEELMLLGFISLLLTVFQAPISQICIPEDLASHMLPCKLENNSSKGPETSAHSTTLGRRLLSGDTSSQKCSHKGMVPFLSMEGLHQLHIFIFVLAVVHVIFCVTTMLLGGARIRQWKHWEDSIKNEISKNKAGKYIPTSKAMIVSLKIQLMSFFTDPANASRVHARHHLEFFRQHAVGHWRKWAPISLMISFFKQFYGSITKSDYIALRLGFITTHCPSYPSFDFHNYMMRTLEVDFKKVVSISWYLWLFVVVFLLLNIEGWHTYFWLAFLPLILLLIVGTKLEHIITRLAEEVAERTGDHEEPQVRPSDEHFWFSNPKLVLYMIHFILFQNSFEIAFFIWIWTMYGFDSCIMEKLSYIIPRLLVGVLVQVLCSYSTLPLYALVTQMGSAFKEGMFDKELQDFLIEWGRRREKE